MKFIILGWTWPACTRDMGLIVTDGKNFISEEKRDMVHQQAYISPSAPAYHLINADSQGRFRIEKEIFTDTLRDSLVQRTKFTPLQGSLTDYHLYVILAPHLRNQGYENTAWVGITKAIRYCLPSATTRS